MYIVYSRYSIIFFYKRNKRANSRYYLVFKYKKCVSLAGDTHLLFYYETFFLIHLSQ